MALTFPSSPVDGQLYVDSVTGNRYIYDSGNGLWKYASNNVGMTVGTAPPPSASVAPGAMWYNTNTGRTFILYDDGDSRQWVENVPAVGSFDSATVAGYANAATQIYLSPVFNTANAVYNQSNVVFGVANGAYGKANTALQNTNVTLAGNLSVTGSHTLVTVPNYRNIPHINTNYTVSNSYNEMSIGPIYIANNVTVTVDPDANWVIV
jgi:hypothetical protein